MANKHDESRSHLMILCSLPPSLSLSLSLLFVRSFVRCIYTVSIVVFSESFRDPRFLPSRLDRFILRVLVSSQHFAINVARVLWPDANHRSHDSFAIPYGSTVRNRVHQSCIPTVLA